MSYLNNPFYSFLPWGRRGISLEINELEQYGTSPQTPVALERAEITIGVNVLKDASSTTTVGVNMQIIGPGDVIGISGDVVVRTEPRNGITNFEPHSFAFIDFYEEDFPWRYSPAKAAADNKLRPWLTLVVLKNDEFTRENAGEGKPLNSIQLNAAIALPFPKHEETWAWAHIQVNDRVNPLNNSTLNDVTSFVNQVIKDRPDAAISRLICPRKLKENTAYTAFLIPTYETGRLAGLGLSIPSFLFAQEPAWDSNPANNTTYPDPPYPPSTQRPNAGEFPIYYEWSFSTGVTGDFEYLIRQLKPAILNPQVGKRKMDVQNVGYGLSYTEGVGNNAGTLILEGALRLPNSTNTPYPYPDNVSNFRTKLRDFVNLGQDMQDLSLFNNTGSYYAGTSNPIGGAYVQDDPIVSAPLYGRWHSLRKRVYLSGQNTGWVDELNLDPRNRVAAALGGDFVRKNQEWLMDKAWDQVGMVIAANKLINWGQLAVESNNALYRKNIESQPEEQFVALTSSTHARVKIGNVSAKQFTLASQLPIGADSSAFRKVRRPDGPLMKRVDVNRVGVGFVNTLTRLAQGGPTGLDIAPVLPPPQTARFTATELSTAVLDSLTIDPNAIIFSITTPSPNPPSMTPNPQEGFAFQGMFNDYSGVFTPANWGGITAQPQLSLSQVKNVVSAGLDPVITIPVSYYDSIKFKKNAVIIPPPDPWRLLPSMAAPSYYMAMYEELKTLGIDFFLPNLHLIPQNSVSILETNQQFIESFMVGANYEMGRELLWRGYPTDQRGTYFKHFWESADNLDLANQTQLDQEINTRDIGEIYNWDETDPLGSHNARSGPNSTTQIVLAIRGDILKKFPNAVIYATPAKWNPDNTQPRIIDPLGVPIYPVFSGKIDPDITLLAFGITGAQARGVSGGPGYFFVFTERPGELRFGLDVNPDPNPPAPPDADTWNNLMWDHVDKTPEGYMTLAPPDTLPLPTTNPPSTGEFNPQIPPPASLPISWTYDPPYVNWAEDSAAMAMILYQNPVLVAFHASEMIN